MNTDQPEVQPVVSIQAQQGARDLEGGERLQKVLAAAGVGSRRHCEELIAQGRVAVNGTPVVVQGLRINKHSDTVHVDGDRVVLDASLAYLALHKPEGYVTSMADDEGRPDLRNLVPESWGRLFHVGRLDVATEGLLLLTNDGGLAHRLMHPSFGVPKTYLADIPGPLGKGARRALREGVELDDGPAKADALTVVAASNGRSLVRIVVHDGRKHLVRRIFAQVGHPVGRLVRTDVGPIALGDLRPGKLRRLNAVEVAALHRLVDL